MENENSTTEIQMLCQQGLLSWSKQVQANTLAQLGSNPFKPLLRATADPVTPSEGSENGSILARTTITFSFAVPQTEGDISQQADQDPPASSRFTQSLQLGLWFQSA